jgi:hypothetical protein
MKKRTVVAVVVSIASLILIVTGALAAPGIEFVSQIGDATWHAWDVAVSGNYAYVAGDTDGLRIIDITNPAIPVQAGRYPGGLGGGSIAVAGNYVYEAYSGLRILNVANPSNPTLAGQYNIASGASASVAISGTHAYLTHSGGLYIIDITNPMAPTQTGFYAISGDVFEVAIVGNYAFIATGGPFDSFQGLRIINVANPSSPSQAGFLSLGGTICEGVAVAGSLAYVTTWDGGLYAINVSNPASPVQVGHINPTLSVDRGVTLSGNHAYLASDNVYVIDVSTPTAPQVVNSYNTGRNLRDLAVKGNYIFAAEEDARLVILWSTFPASGNITTGGGTLTASGDGTNYLLPAGTFTSTTVVTHTARFAGNAPATGNLASIGHLFDLTAAYLSDGQPAQPAPGRLYTITVPYSDTEKGPAIENTLALYWWNGGQWVKETSSVVDTIANTITAAPNHFSQWAVLGETRRVYLPLTVKN